MNVATLWLALSAAGFGCAAYALAVGVVKEPFAETALIAYSTSAILFGVAAVVNVAHLAGLV